MAWRTYHVCRDKVRRLHLWGCRRHIGVDATIYYFDDQASVVYIWEAERRHRLMVLSYSKMGGVWNGWRYVVSRVVCRILISGIHRYWLWLMHKLFSQGLKDGGILPWENIKLKPQELAQNFVFNLKATNGQNRYIRVYNTLESCKKGINSVSVISGSLEDQTCAASSGIKSKFEIYTDKAGEFRFRLKGEKRTDYNGQWGLPAMAVASTA